MVARWFCHEADAKGCPYKDRMSGATGWWMCLAWVGTSSAQVLQGAKHMLDMMSQETLDIRFNAVWGWTCVSFDKSKSNDNVETTKARWRRSRELVKDGCLIGFITHGITPKDNASFNDPFWWRFFIPFNANYYDLLLKHQHEFSGPWLVLQLRLLLWDGFLTYPKCHSQEVLAFPS